MSQVRNILTAVAEGCYVLSGMNAVWHTLPQVGQVCCTVTLVSQAL